MSEQDKQSTELASAIGHIAGTESGERAIIETAQKAVYPEVLDKDGLYSVGPQGATILNLERFRDNPDRQRGVYKPATVDALRDYVAQHHDAEETTVWVDLDGAKVVAVLDDHAPRAANWGEHRAELTLSPTPEWKFWADKNNTFMGQQDFADHVEAGVRQIRNPNAADMLEIAQSFHATTDAQFRSRIVLASGEVRMAYDETIDAQAGKAGDITIPQEFELAISPFVGEEEYKVMARFRYRVRSGNLSLGYSLIEPDLVVRDCLERIAETLGEKFERVYLGVPADKGTAGR